MILVLMALIAALPIQAQDKDNPKHPELRKFDTVTLAQQNGPDIQIIGYGRFHLSYSETVDGYTVMRNDESVYEYAERSSGGDLEPGGKIAHDPEDRDQSEKKYLSNIEKHLRYRPPKLEEILEKENRFFRLNDEND